MPIVKKANCERTISDDKVSEYLEMGYSLIDGSGTVLKKGKPQTKGDLQTALSAALEENKALKAEIDKLSAALEENKSDKFKCPVCGKEYATQNSLDKHIKEKHPEET